MYDVSERYIEKITSNFVTATWLGRLVTANGLIFNLTSRNFVESSSEITSEICTGDSIEIGTTCASSFKLDIFLDYDAESGNYTLNGETINRYDFFGGTIRLTFRLYFDDETYEDVKCKTYTIENAERTADILSIDAYDNMLKFNDPLGATGVGTGYTFLQYACNACNVQLGTTAEEFASLPNGNLGVFIHPSADNKITTWRDLVGFIASSVCAFAIIGHDDKLYIRPYGTEPVRTIPTTWRYNSSVADYDSIYTQLIAHNVVTNEDETYVEYPNDGLSYDLGTNPFLQFEVDETRRQALQAILDALNLAQYTPFTATTPLDPSFEPGDVIQLEGGQATDANFSAITKLTYSLGGSMSLECVGKNPKTVEVETALDKRFDAISSYQSDDPIHYYDYVNTEDIEIADGQSKRVIVFRYAATKVTRVELFSEVLLYLDTTELETDTSFSETSGWLKVTYYINGVAVENYYPLEEYMDGEHILPIIYEFSTSPIAVGTFEVWITMKGASITIGQNQARAWISGIGLVGDEAWDGTVSVYDSMNRVSVFNKRLFRGATDSVEGSVHEPLGDSVRDSLGRIRMQPLFRGFTDENESTSNLMSFTPTVNTEYIETDANVENYRWIGEGSILRDTAKHLITAKIEGVTGVTTRSLAAVYYASFNDGETWVGHTEDGWIENAEMIQATISAITAEEWAEGGNVVRIKVLLEDDAWLGSLNLYGGVVYEEPEE